MYGAAPLRVAVTGASGMVGTALATALRGDGHTVVPLVRRTPRAGEVAWDPAHGRIDAAGLEGLDAVVHLAGESLAALWTSARKRKIRASRVGGTTLLATALAGLTRKPVVLISASAVGIYGDRGDEPLDERSPPGTGFLADVARAWEASAAPAAAAGIRVAHPRFGMVLSRAGGGLARLLPLFQLGLGGRLGNGAQWMPAVAIDDVVGAIRHAIATPALSGPFNVSIPEPVTNAEFTRTLARILHRPAIFVAPAHLLRLVLDGLADETLLGSARVEPKALLTSGYLFKCPTIESALRCVL
jgi:uncharacterized protein (TIGR01777 family)